MINSEIQQFDDGKQGMFFIERSGKRLAELSYFYQDPDTINANHTFVAVELRGQGIADQLYQALLAWLAQHPKKLVAGCSYIAAKQARKST
ncbi:GNAT family N-acetyltransferase [Mergibacter septicus]|uniref:GNAT family N-acetyltransferase n=1 Tax=Mergibacter septicus TaxID=221402 RepID=A0A8E3MER9_9PAST|nr:GNAT family N-acetyltransferase [Mergibacter septicus]AWX16314.1 GNAT family N-acetyltransferase [Mergibacter septicus]QDJ13899.1 GNAT family N-acetyltransferase [Mergibacter septicus]QDJ15565.1 GNAT family N-acetyltransferase [Mergibacter septicus]UTU48852.1 N-acetyltransferase [Mergibacter septicus]WMR96847.1 N-acetyltransferase [Mergibacter septicus]